MIEYTNVEQSTPDVESNESKLSFISTALDSMVEEATVLTPAADENKFLKHEEFDPEAKEHKNPQPGVASAKESDSSGQSQSPNNNIDIIRNEVDGLLNELKAISSARANLQDRLHKMND